MLKYLTDDAGDCRQPRGHVDPVQQRTTAEVRFSQVVGGGLAGMSATNSVLDFSDKAKASSL